MQPHERDLDIISLIVADAATLAMRIEHFSMTEDTFVNDRTEDGEIAC